MSLHFFYTLFLSTILNLNIFGMEGKIGSNVITQQLGQSITHYSDIDSDSEYFDALEHETDSKLTQKELFAPLLEQFISNRQSERITLNEYPEELIDIEQFLYVPLESEKIIFENALKNAPEEVQSIIEVETNLDSIIGPRLNRLLLVGKPGTGKSDLAKALACKLGTCYFITAADLASKYRNEAHGRLDMIIKAVLKAPGKSVLVIDEINMVLENYSNVNNNDTGMTGMSLWVKIDKNKSNPNFFLIGTANDSKKIPPQLQSRFRHQFVTIPSPSLEDRKEIILYHLSRFKIPNLFEHKYIEQITSRTADFAVRDIESLCLAAFYFAHKKGKSPVLTTECFERAFKQRENDERVYMDFSSQISDEERRHRESINLQCDLHAKSLEKQEDFHNENKKLQNSLHQSNLESQKILHDKNIVMQKKLHDQSVQIQHDLHRQSSNQQRQQHNESWWQNALK